MTTRGNTIQDQHMVSLDRFTLQPLTKKQQKNNSLNNIKRRAHDNKKIKKGQSLGKLKPVTRHTLRASLRVKGQCAPANVTCQAIIHASNQTNR